MSPESGLFRPYCLKDPVEYKYDRHPCPPSYPTYNPAYLQYRNIEDLATAQAILDLSAGARAVETVSEPELTLSPNSDIKTEDDAAGAAVFKINGGRTTAYTYEVGWKNYYVVRNAGCACSRYTLKLLFPFLEYQAKYH